MRVRGKLGLDAAVVMTLVGRGWGILSGLATLWLVARYTTPAEQGYYYTFTNIVGLQVFFELGLSFVLMQMVSHEATGVYMARGVLWGDRQRKADIYSLIRLAIRVYRVAAFLFLACAVAGGYIFFAHDSHAGEVTWELPWLLTISFSSLLLFMSPLLSVFEGLGQVTEIARLRLVQTVLSSIAAWLLLANHQALFALAAVAMVSAIVQACWLALRMRRLIAIAMAQRGKGRFEWKRDIWPFQWKIAVSWISGYLIFQIITPLVFIVKGAAVSGKVGMAFAVATAMTSLSMAWINTKAPTFGNMISTRKWDELNRLFQHTLRASLIFLGMLCVSVLASVYLLRRFDFELLDKLPSLAALAMVSFAVIFNQVVFARAVYLRAGKREPFMYLSMGTGICNLVLVYIALQFKWDDAVFLAYLLATGFSLVWSARIFNALRYR